jgi:RNA polymerase sigma factor (sigma-70 family)
MTTTNFSEFLRRLTRQIGAENLVGHSDRQLVERALAGRDETAFEAIVYRHSAMVYRVCWRVLQHPHDAEDAFQATFLILAQKLRSLRKHASLASWLHGVAHRVAVRAKTQSAARRRRESAIPLPDSIPPDDMTWKEIRSVLDAQLNRLPDKWRLPLILCYLEGRTQDEAASQLGWSKSTLRRRLHKARAALSRRLTKRGIIWSAALSAVLFSDCIASAAPAPAHVAATVVAASDVVAGNAVATVAPATVAALAEGVLKTMLSAKIKIATVFLLVVSVVATGAGMLVYTGLPAASSPTEVKNQLVSDAGVREIDNEMEVFAAAEKPRFDNHGDPSLPRAIAHLGALQCWNPIWASALAYTNREKTLASAYWDGAVRWWDPRCQDAVLQSTS